MSAFSELEKYVEIDTEKIRILETVRPVQNRLYSKGVEYDLMECNDISFDLEPKRKMSKSEPEKTCPKCGKRFPCHVIYCPDCLQTLKDVSDHVNVKDIKANPKIEFRRLHSSDNILTDECYDAIQNFDFSIDDFREITHSIKSQAFKNLAKMVKDYSIDLASMEVLDRVLLFAKSFVSVEFKSYGGELGYFEFNRIYVDDRQRRSLQITTVIHELAHFLLKEILVHVTCHILDINKNKHVESVIVYILSNSIFNSLIDEYAAHTVEGRFTVFGYQDYSSFTALQNELEAEHVDIAKTIGNTFAIYIKDIVEGFLDWDLRDEIKEEFLNDTIEEPDYAQLRFENCNKLSDEGFIKALWLILSEGFQDADMEVIETYMENF